MTMRGDRRHCHYLLICSVACAAAAAAAEDDVSYAALYAIDRDRDRYDVYAAGYLLHDVRGLELLATLGACVIDCITIAPAAQQQQQYPTSIYEIH